MRFAGRGSRRSRANADRRRAHGLADRELPRDWSRLGDAGTPCGCQLAFGHRLGGLDSALRPKGDGSTAGVAAAMGLRRAGLPVGPETVRSPHGLGKRPMIETRTSSTENECSFLSLVSSTTAPAGSCLSSRFTPPTRITVAHVVAPVARFWRLRFSTPSLPPSPPGGAFRRLCLLIHETCANPSETEKARKLLVFSEGGFRLSDL